MEPLLLVEDKPELRAMLRKALEREGYDVDEAADGSAAVNKIHSRLKLIFGRHVIFGLESRNVGCFQPHNLIRPLFWFRRSFG